ncbi:TonB-dependent receptor [Dysgonomonas sp. 511]|uniref:SusC/RagA family TonB-linked outer membrane protein n=1 Tax=Dysgonomonas sp. 511 TaxID=2302930 RepID=UPI0013D61061|nr:TonB-dependent receptor [Dysgonomonas sp. 511]NDV78134.1 TonB-dependent receptor [Dysgonomonas sp. 511]
MIKQVVMFLLLFCSIAIYGQNDVKGKVIDEENEPLTGVTIGIKGTTRGTITDLDGNYSISVAKGETLVFSYVGMIPQEIAYTGQSTIDIVMNNSSLMLEEMVVIGYQTIKKADLTGAVSVFNTDEMKNKTVTGTVGDALGTLPGLNVRTAGSPGSEGKVVIRGTGTFGNSDPLYIVDGIASGANRDFNFNDIESIQVLKDASAAAIYGSRAGNGVIIITTKQGKEGKMKVDVSTRTTIQWLPRYNLTDRNEWMMLNDYAFYNGKTQSASHSDGNTDWQDEVFKTGIVGDHNISFSGGTKDSRYFISGNYQSNSGTTIGTESNRFTFRANTSSSRNFGENFLFTVGENVAVSHFKVDELNTNPIIDVYRMLPTTPVYDSRNPGGYGYGDGNRDVTFGTNPLAKEELENTTNSNLRIRGNLFAELEAFKSLKYRFNFGFDFSNDKYRYLRKVGSWSYNQPLDPSSLTRQQAQSRGFVFDNTLEYNKKFGGHDISAVLGTSYTDNDYERIWGTKTNVLTNSAAGSYYEQLDAVVDDPKTGGYSDMEKLFSVFGRVNYNYDQRYLLSFTMRRDQSSKFAPEHDTGYFPSVSAGWRISQEKFFNVSFIDDLKLRGNYGMLGTSNIGYWDWVEMINNFPQAVFGSDEVVTGMTQVELKNYNLKWEKLTQMNLGFDLVMLKNRFMLSVDYFNKKTKDVLTPMTILLSTGHSGNAPYVNAATLRNRGFEFSATWNDKIGKDFKYGVNINGSYMKNKIESLGYGQDGFTEWNTKSLVGGSIGEWYLVKTDGIFRTAEEAAAHVTADGKPITINGYTPQAGDVKYIDYNGDGQITDADRQYCGTGTPKFQLGMNLNFEYKGFDLQLQFTGAFGHKVFNGPRSSYDYFSDNSNYRADYDPWTPENPNAKDPRPIYSDSRNVIGFQDRWLENGNYLRLKQAALGYNLPKSILKNTFHNIRVYVNAQNLLTFTSYTGLDPEFLNTNIWMRGYDGGAFPNPKGITFGAQVSF